MVRRIKTVDYSAHDYITADPDLAQIFVTAIGQPAVVLDGWGRVLVPNSDFPSGLSKTEDEAIDASQGPQFLRRIPPTSSTLAAPQTRHQITDANDIKEISDRLNNTPQKCLG